MWDFFFSEMNTSLRTLFLPLAYLSLAVFALKLPSLPSRTEEAENEQQEGNTVAGRNRWMLERYADPATGKIPAGIRQAELAFAANLPNDASLSRSQDSAALAFQWIRRGPWNVGGISRAFAYDVTNPQVLLAGTNSGGMWRSTDGGQTWDETFPKTSYDGVTCIAQDKRPGKTNIWYAGSGDAYASASDPGAFYSGNGIRKSVDGGITWTRIPNSGSMFSFDHPFDVTYNIATRAQDTADVVFVACVGGIYRSTNGGTTFTRIKGTALGTTYSFYSDVCVTPSGIVYATLGSDGTQKGIYRSTDGITFQRFMPANFPTTYERIKIGYAPTDETQLYFLANGTTNFGTPDTNYQGDVEWNSLWKCKYTGPDSLGNPTGSWTDLSQNLPTSGGPFDKFYCQGSYDMVVKVHPTDTNLVIIGGTNLFRSTNGFKDANHTTFIGGYKQGTSLPVVEGYDNHHPDQHEIFFHPTNPDVVFSGCDGGVYKTNDIRASTVSWTHLNNGYLTTMFYTVAINHVLPSPVVVGGAQDNGTWYSNSNYVSQPWLHVNGGDGSYCAVADSNKFFIFSIQNGKIRKCRLDNNGNVTAWKRIEPIGGKNYRFINPFALDPNNPNLFYLPAGNALWRNDSLDLMPYNNGWDSISTGWHKFADTLTSSGVYYSAIGVSKNPANMVYLGTTSRNVYKVTNADQGDGTYTNITSTVAPNNFPGSANVSCIAVDPYDGNKIMVTFSNYAVYSIFYSENGGTTWKKVAGNLESNASGTGTGPSVRWATFAHITPDSTLYFVATSTGVYATSKLRTDVDSTVWVQQGTQVIGNSVCDMLDYRESDKMLVVATHARGIYSTWLDKDNGLLVPSREQLRFSVYPNPAKEFWNVETAGNFITNTELQVTDMGGRVVRSFRLKGAADLHPLRVPCDDLPQGFYFISVGSGNNKVTRKVLKI
jgi:hypothetical protein